MTFLCDRRKSFAVLLALVACRAWAAYVAVPDAEHVVSARRHTGIPSMAAAKGGRLWVTFYGSLTGGEDSNNYCTLATSADGGRTWKDVLVADPDGKGPLRAFDPEVWIAPDGRLFWTWTERVSPLQSESKSANAGCLADPKNDKLMCVELAGDTPPKPPYPQPRQIARGVMMCKPVVRRDGAWLFPSAHWGDAPSACIYESKDAGKTFACIGGVTLPPKAREFDEHAVAELGSGDLLAFIRTVRVAKCMESISHDGGRTWSEPRKARFAHTSSRLFMRKLNSGNLLLVKHGKIDEDCGRRNLTAYLSRDDGATWKGGLLIDARANASYPDGDQAADGLIHVVYDHDRLGAQEILMASFTEEDVLAGKAVSGRSRFRQTVSSKKRQASPQEVKGRRIVENGFAVKGLFFKRAWSRNRLEFSLAGDGAISLQCTATNKCDTWWAATSRVVKLEKNCAALLVEFTLESDIPLSVADPGLDWGNKLDWYDAAGARIGSSPLSYTLIGARKGSPRMIAAVPGGASAFSMQFAFDMPDIPPGRRLVYRNLNVTALSGGDVAALSGSVGGRWMVVKDASPPLVRVVSDSPFTIPSQDLELEIMDESPLDWKTLRVSVDGGDRTADVRIDGRRLKLPAPSGGWKQGLHEARVHLADVAGHARESRTLFFRGDKPRGPSVTLRDDGFALVDGKPFFPIGIYDVKKNAFNAWSWDRAVGDLAKAGFNLLHSYGTSAHDPGFRAALEKHGVYRFQSADPESSQFAESMRFDPTVVAWYLADDTSRNTTPGELNDRAVGVKAIDPLRLTCHAEHVDGGIAVSRTRPYVGLTDGLLPEIYPVKDDTPATAERCVAEVIREMKAAVLDNIEGAGGTPRFVWPIIQDFLGWGAWKRYPTENELRAMSWAAIIHGANGILWYKYHCEFNPGGRGNTTAITTEARWRGLTNLVAQIKAVVPALLSREPAPEVSCRIVAGPRTDALGNPSVSVLAKSLGGVSYVMTVNSSRRRVKAHIAVKDAKASAATVLWEGRKADVGRDGGWTDDFAPHAVHVYVLKEARNEPPAGDFAFRRELVTVHRNDRRDMSARPSPGEFVFQDGATVADEDFADYLNTSMKTRAVFSKTASTVRHVIDGTLCPREYTIAVDGKGVRIAAHDERAAHQAYYHLEDLMNLRKGPFLKHGFSRRRSVFSPRMTHSGYALDEFPDGHLAQIAHYGMDAILVFVEGLDRTKGGRRHDIGDLIRRARRHGLDTYIYSYITAFAHPADPGSQEVFDRTYGRIAAAYPDAKGIVFVGESAEFPSKDERTSGMSASETRKKGDPRPPAGRFPSRDYPDWINAVKRTIHSKAPGMEFIFWTYNWGWAKEDLRLAFVDALPKDVSLMATFEMYERHSKSNGFRARIDDYSLCVPGPGRYFASEAAEAAKCGLKLYAMSNTGGLTWDFGTIPYLPMPYQWKRRWDAMRKANAEWDLTGLMENHHYGWYPSFVSELAKEAFTEGGIPFDEHMRMIAARDFGEGNVDEALRAWKLWSEAIADYTATSVNQYGPFRIGPAYPYNAMRERIDNAKVPWPGDAINSRFICRQNYLERNFQNTGAKAGFDIAETASELELLEGMERKFREGAEAFSRMGTEESARMANFGEYLMRCVVTAENVKRGAIAETKGDSAAVERLAASEYANALKAVPLLRRDSRLGWEPTMGYAGGEKMIEIKLKRMRERYESCRSLK